MSILNQEGKMKRFLTILLVLVLSFSLFVSCDPNTAQKDSNDDDNKPSGGGYISGRTFN